MAAVTVLNGVSVGARQTTAASAAIVSASQGVALTLNVTDTSDEAVRCTVLAQFSADGANFSDAVATPISVVPGGSGKTVYGVISAPAGVNVKVSLQNKSDEAVTATLIALAV